MTCSILCQILFLSRLLGALAPTPLGAARGHSGVLEAPTYQSPSTNWSWRWQFMAQKTSVDECVFFDMRFSVTSQASCSLCAIWLSLLSSCIQHVSSGQRPLRRCTSTNTAALMLPRKRLEEIWQAVLSFSLHMLCPQPHQHSCPGLIVLTWNPCSSTALSAGVKTSAHPWLTQCTGKNTWAFKNTCFVLGLAFAFLFPFLQTMTAPVIKIQFLVKKFI